MMKKTKAQAKTDRLIAKYGGFFAFNNKQLTEGYDKITKSGHVVKGDKVKHLSHGLHVPSKNVNAFIKEL